MEPFGDLDYLLVAFLAGAVLSCAAIAAMQSSFRVGGAPSWILLVVLIPLPLFAARPLAGLVMLDPNAALPVVGIGVALSVLWIHIVLPAAIPDFQASTLSATCVPAVCLGLGLFIAGATTQTFTSLTFGHEEAVFDKGAGLDLNAPGEF